MLTVQRYQLAGDQQAHDMLIKLADWVVVRVQQSLDRGGEELWQCILKTEWGGMNEVLFNIFAITGR